MENKSNLNFMISPPKRGHSTKSGQEDSARPQFLTLGTFTSVPKLHFERVQVGHSKYRTLVVRNPTSQVIRFWFPKLPPKAFEMDCPAHILIPDNDQLNITFKWTPTDVGRCFEALHCYSELSGVRLTIHLLGEAEPGHFKAKSLIGSARRGMLQPPNRLLDTSIRSLEPPSRRETYSITPTVNKVQTFAETIASLKLNFEVDDIESGQRNHNQLLEKVQNIEQALMLKSNPLDSNEEMRKVQMLRALDNAENTGGKGLMSQPQDDIENVEKSLMPQPQNDIGKSFLPKSPDVIDELLEKCQAQILELWRLAVSTFDDDDEDDD